MEKKDERSVAAERKGKEKNRKLKPGVTLAYV